MRRKKKPSPEQAEEIEVKDFFNMILPGAVKLMSDHYICGDSYRCVWQTSLVRSLEWCCKSRRWRISDMIWRQQG